MFRVIIARSTKLLKNTIRPALTALGIVAIATLGVAAPAQAVGKSTGSGPVITLADPTADNRYAAGEFIDFVVTDPDGITSINIKVTAAGETFENTLTPNTTTETFGLNTGVDAVKGTVRITAVDSLGNSTAYSYAFIVKRK